MSAFMSDEPPAAEMNTVDPWLAQGIGDGALMRANDATNLSQPVLLAHNTLAMALKERAAHNPAHPEHGAALFSETQEHALPVVCLAHGARHPERMVLEASKERGLDTHGKSVYVTHHPLPDAAQALIDAGISKLYIDHQPVRALDEATVRKLCEAHTALRNAGCALQFIDVPHGIDPLKELMDAASIPHTDIVAPVAATATLITKEHLKAKT